jgi:hypothetical protein
MALTRVNVTKHIIILINYECRSLFSSNPQTVTVLVLSWWVMATFLAFTKQGAVPHSNFLLLSCA